MESHQTQRILRTWIDMVLSGALLTRQPEPRCPTCRSTPTVALRTDYAIYYRCPRCADVWAIEKPAGPLAPAVSPFRT